MVYPSSWSGVIAIKLIAIVCIIVACADAVSLNQLSGAKLQVLQSGGLANAPVITFDKLMSDSSEPVIVFAVRRAG